MKEIKAYARNKNLGLYWKFPTGKYITHTTKVAKYKYITKVVPKPCIRFLYATVKNGKVKYAKNAFKKENYAKSKGFKHITIKRIGNKIYAYMRKAYAKKVKYYKKIVHKTPVRLCIYTNYGHPAIYIDSGSCWGWRYIKL